MITTATTCSICLESISALDALITNCQHTFHYMCLRKWAREAMRHKRRFFPVGFIAMDDIPMHECPLCRSAVTCYIYRHETHALKYAYAGHNPYRLQVGTLVYYYYALRQPGTPRSGYLGFVTRLPESSDLTPTTTNNNNNHHFEIQCLWGGCCGGNNTCNVSNNTHSVPYYCVFDIFFLALPNGGIPTRSQMNVLYVPEHLSQGFVTEERNILAELPLDILQQHLRQYVRQSAHLISPLAPRSIYCDTPLHFFMTVYLQPALSGVVSDAIPLPNPTYEVQFSAEEYRHLVLQEAIGLNQARIILGYIRAGFNLPDEVDAPRVVHILRDKLKKYSSGDDRE